MQATMDTPDATNGLESIAAEKSEIQAQEVADQQYGTENIIDQETRGVKRPAGDDDGSDIPITTEGEVSSLSKGQLRKLKKRKMFEEKKVERRATRRDKRHQKQERRRIEKENAASEGREPQTSDAKKHKKPRPTRVPISIIMDCQFEQYMMEKEITSLSSQVTRCYSDNRNAAFPVHLFVSSYGGQMQERFDVALHGQYKSWKGIRFMQEDFVDAASQARKLMTGPGGGKVIQLLEENAAQAGEPISISKPPESKRQRKAMPVPEPEADDVDKSIVYLTADSPYTLDRLEPNTSYVIGGIIDRNREKGLCYKVARERKVRTAKLPIGEFMVLQSRHVLATNHVVEIMLRYLELGDWGAAFMKVIPTRKGGTLKDDASPDSDQEEQPDAEAADEPPVDVEGDNEADGLEENALAQERWSAPPEEPQEETDGSTPANQPSSNVPDVSQPDTVTATSAIPQTGDQQDAQQQTEISDAATAGVEGDNADEGLQKNVLDERSWSNPPAES